jgi:hypothetical protein
MFFDHFLHSHLNTHSQSRYGSEILSNEFFLLKLGESTQFVHNNGFPVNFGGKKSIFRLFLAKNRPFLKNIFCTFFIFFQIKSFFDAIYHG